MYRSVLADWLKNWMEPKTKKLLNVKVFAQSSPNDNLLLVQALKKRGHIVAATGMGIHDPKTLREVRSYLIKTLKTHRTISKRI